MSPPDEPRPDSQAPQTVRDRVFPWAAAALALLLDLPSLFSGIWIDEWATLIATSSDWARCWSAASGEPPPPGHYVLTWLLFRLLAPGAVAVRLIPLASHLGAVVGTYRYARAWHDRSVAEVASIALAAAPLMGWFGTNGRPYALIVWIGVYCVGAFRAQRWVRFAVSAAALGWLHTFALVLPALLWLWALGTGAGRPATAAGVGAFVLWAPELPHLIDKVVVNPLHPLAYEPCDLGTLAATFKWWYGLDVLSRWPLALLAAIGMLSIAVLGTSRHHRFECALWLGGMLPLCGVAIWVKPIYAPKLFLWTLPFALIAVASALLRGPVPALAVAWLAIVLAGGAAASGGEKTGERAAARLLAARIGPQDRVLHAPGTEGTVTWYLARLERTGTGAPRTWLLRQRSRTAPADPDVDYEILTVPGAASTVPTTWPSPRVLLFDPSTPTPVGTP